MPTRTSQRETDGRFGIACTDLLGHPFMQRVIYLCIAPLVLGFLLLIVILFFLRGV